MRNAHPMPPQMRGPDGRLYNVTTSGCRAVSDSSAQKPVWSASTDHRSRTALSDYGAARGFIEAGDLAR